MVFASAAPAEYDAYLPDSEEFRRNTRSDGRYRIAQYKPGGREIVLERNPAWSQESDPIRHPVRQHHPLARHRGAVRGGATAD